MKAWRAKERQETEIRGQRLLDDTVGMRVLTRFLNERLTGDTIKEIEAYARNLLYLEGVDCEVEARIKGSSIQLLAHAPAKIAD